MSLSPETTPHDDIWLGVCILYVDPVIFVTVLKFLEYRSTYPPAIISMEKVSPAGRPLKVKLPSAADDVLIAESPTISMRAPLMGVLLVFCTKPA